MYISKEGVLPELFASPIGSGEHLDPEKGKRSSKVRYPPTSGKTTHNL